MGKGRSYDEQIIKSANLLHKQQILRHQKGCFKDVEVGIAFHRLESFAIVVPSLAPPNFQGPQPHPQKRPTIECCAME